MVSLSIMQLLSLYGPDHAIHRKHLTTSRIENKILNTNIAVVLIIVRKSKYYTPSRSELSETWAITLVSFLSMFKQTSVRSL